MNLATALLFYGLVGAAVAGAILLRRDALAPADRGFRALTAVVFWPLYLPLLLQGAPAEIAASGDVAAGDLSQPASILHHELAQAIARVEAELDLALASLDGWSDTVLAHERDRFVELRAAWRQQATRVAELDQLLAQPAFVADTEQSAAVAPSARGQRAAKSETARRQNIERLRSVRDRMHDDLLGTLAKVRELVTMIHLARYTGAPVTRAEELLGEITAAVAGLSEVAGWRPNDVGDSSLILAALPESPAAVTTSAHRA